jgi:hypothetical protein
MRKALIITAAFVSCSLASSPADAWGFAAHRLIMRRAIELLPPELKPFFTANRDEIVVRVIDPDLWRNVGWDEDPNHYLDFGMPELGPYPFTALPRDYSSALERFGMATMKRVGFAPWREAEQFGNLRRGFEGFKRRSLYAPMDVILFSAVASHYLQDAHVPFHATNNYDGQLTGQHGIHARFESILIERFESRLALGPQAPKPIAHIRDFMFDTLLAGYKLVDPVLAADKAAIAGKDAYDDEYFEKFFAAVKPILEQRLNESITATAAMIMGAWEEAGRPALELTVAQPVQKVKR